MPAEFLVPEYISGKPTFVPYAGDIQRLLKEGDPSISWVGDPRLYITPRDGAEGFAVGRMNEDGTRSLICVSKAPHKLDKGLLIKLRDSDTRYVDVYASIEKKNAAVKKAHNDRAKDTAAQMLEHVAFQLHKDLGHKA